MHGPWLVVSINEPDPDPSGPGGVVIQHDIRDIFIEVLRGPTGLSDARAVFPGYMAQPVGLLGGVYGESFHAVVCILCVGGSVSGSFTAPMEIPIIDTGSDEHFMREALRQASKAGRQDEVPIGAIIVHAGEIIGRAWNQVETLQDATAHAEMLALTQAQSAMENWRLTECDLYVTKEPCPMCAGAIMHCRIRRVIFGCPDVKGGAAGGFWNLLQAPNLNHQCEITGGVLSEESVRLLKNFFAQARARRAAGETHTKGSAGSSIDVSPGLFGAG